jgi:exonuclease III
MKCWRQWVKPETVGLYAEPQRAAHCGASAANSLLHRRAIKGPRFITGHMEATGVPARGWDSPTHAYYDDDGNYALATIGHIIYEITAEDVMLEGQTPLYTNSEYNKFDILARLPKGCTQFLVLDHVMYGGHWYVIGKSHATGEWCNLDSMLNSEGRGYNPILLDEDWTRIKGRQGATLLCLMRKDAYRNNGTVRLARNSQRDPSDFRSTWEKPLVDGRKVVVYTQQVRSAQQMYDTNDPCLRDPTNIPTIPPLPLPHATHTDTEEAELVEQAATALIIAHAQGLDPDRVNPAAHRAAEAARRAAEVARHAAKAAHPHAHDTGGTPDDQDPAQTDAEHREACRKATAQQQAHAQQQQQKACAVKPKAQSAPPAPIAAADKRQPLMRQRAPAQKKARGSAQAADVAPAKDSATAQPGGPTKHQKQPEPTAVQQSIRAFLTTSGKTVAAGQPAPKASKTHTIKPNYPQAPKTQIAAYQPKQLGNTVPRQQQRLREEKQTDQASTIAAAASREQHTAVTQKTASEYNVADTPALVIDVLQSRGLRSGSWRDVDHHIACSAEIAPIIIMSETKLTKDNTRHLLIRKMANGYKKFHSTHPANRSPQAGVSIAVPDEIIDACSSLSDHTPEDLHGYLQHIEMHLPASKPLHIIGVYCPVTTSQGDDAMRNPAAHIYRSSIYKHIIATMQDSLQATRAGHAERQYHVVVAGDFNAAAHPSDRPGAQIRCKGKHRMGKSCRSPDCMHQAFLHTMKTAGLAPTQDLPEQRPMTYHTLTAAGVRTPTSRIDDILTTAADQARHSATIIDTSSWETDHNGLRWTCPYQALQMTPPPMNAPAITDDGKRKLQTPIPVEAYAKLKIMLQEKLSSKYTKTFEKLTILTAEVERQQPPNPNTQPPLISTLGGGSSYDEIRDRAEDIMRMLTEANDIALQTCPTVPINNKGKLHNRCGTASKKYKQAKTARKVTAQWAAAPTEQAATEVLASAKAAHTKQLIDTYQTENPEETRQDVAAAIRKRMLKKIHQINRDHMTFAAQIKRHKQQKFADQNQKVANRIATGTYMKRNSQALKYLEDERNNNTIVTGAPCKEVIHSYIAARAAAQDPASPQHTPQQQRSQSSAPEPSPFTLPTAADRFNLEHPPPTTCSLHHIIQDPCTFKQCISSLSNNKCPGPDGIVNEILKALPDDCKQAIHMLFQIMWATGITPTAWKKSTTVLLYKHKGNITNLRYYRRIGLENTVYKLWTRMVTTAMTDYGERNAVHSHSQAGFRSKRSTHEQVENLVMALEDALLTKQDIYLLQIDFSEAFDTVHHNKLIQVLTALGFPPRCSESSE